MGLVCEEIRRYAHVAQKILGIRVGQSCALSNPLALKHSVIGRRVAPLFDAVLEPGERRYAGRCIFVNMNALAKSLCVLNADPPAYPPNDGRFVRNGAGRCVALA